jgi:beta-lactamase class A
MMSRRVLLTGSLVALAPSRLLAAAGGELQQGLAALEARHGGRLGAAMLDTASGRLVTHRGDERFPLCSTYKLLSAAFVLARVDRGEEDLARRVVYSQAELVPYSPTTGQHVGAGGLSVAALCEAAMTLSDNTAANLLLDSFGGPPALTSYLRSLGDELTRLDRREPALNEAAPGDPRDTTTPVAMLETVRKTVLGTALSAASRAQLIAWMVANKTGDKRVRGGVPAGWRIGDKTGSGAHAVTNDVAVIWPPGRPPLIVTAYYAEASGSDGEREAVLAEIGRLAAA